MTKLTSLRVPKDLYAEIEKRAKKENRNFSNMVITLLLEAVKK